MLQSFVLIHEFIKGPYSHSPPTASLQSPDNQDPIRHELIPETILINLGFRVYSVTHPDELNLLIKQVDAVILWTEAVAVERWRKQVHSLRVIPIIWWCDSVTFPGHECKLDPGIDGFLGPSMNSLEIHCSLMISVNHYFQRTAWEQEREQLLSRLEERKWIDQAKRIISEMKRITEAEAYDLLRKQAMNDRKRIVDVATSIVTVYQLLQEENKGGRRK
ncbi:MAG: hypothetical protein K0R67_3425 [Paenibacillus sp.]|jgi:response regulator NasT|nr:hypothetical protein [Paenibacillus sp.]